MKAAVTVLLLSITTVHWKGLPETGVHPVQPVNVDVAEEGTADKVAVFPLTYVEVAIIIVPFPVPEVEVDRVYVVITGVVLVPKIAVIVLFEFITV